MTEKITSNQENRLNDLFRDAVRALGLSKEEAQEIIANGGVMQNQVKEILKKLGITEKRFGPAITEFKLTVPVDYKHDRYVDQYAKHVKKQKTTYGFNDNLSSGNYSKASTQLEPGKTYLVKIFPILQRVESEDCMTFLRKQNAIFVGAHGLFLAHDLKKAEFPVSKYTVSFDEKDSLWKDSDGDLRVPDVKRRSDGVWDFNLGYFQRSWAGGNCLLCFCDLPAKQGSESLDA